MICGLWVQTSREDREPFCLPCADRILTDTRSCQEIDVDAAAAEALTCGECGGSLVRCGAVILGFFIRADAYEAKPFCMPCVSQSATLTEIERRGAMIFNDDAGALELTCAQCGRNLHDVAEAIA